MLLKPLVNLKTKLIHFNEDANPSQASAKIERTFNPQQREKRLQFLEIANYFENKNDIILAATSSDGNSGYRGVTRNGDKW